MLLAIRNGLDPKMLGLSLRMWMSLSFLAVLRRDEFLFFPRFVVCVKSQPSDHQAESAFAESSLLAARRVINEGHGDALGPANEELPRSDSRRIVLKDHS
jgi:hypothetical protein